MVADVILRTRVERLYQILSEMPESNYERCFPVVVRILRSILDHNLVRNCENPDLLLVVLQSMWLEE